VSFAPCGSGRDGCRVRRSDFDAFLVASSAARAAGDDPGPVELSEAVEDAAAALGSDDGAEIRKALLALADAARDLAERLDGRAAVADPGATMG
jgi:hypothetical protein